MLCVMLVQAVGVELLFQIVYVINLSMYLSFFKCVCVYVLMSMEENNSLVSLEVEFLKLQKWSAYLAAG